MFDSSRARQYSVLTKTGVCFSYTRRIALNLAVQINGRHLPYLRAAGKVLLVRTGLRAQCVRQSSTTA
jgi:hypothetical protein